MRKNVNIPDDGRNWLWRSEEWTCGHWKFREFRMSHPKKIVDGLVALKVGPGGPTCACCFPAPGSKDRRKLIKIARRKAKRLALKEQMDYCDDLKEAS